MELRDGRITLLVNADEVRIELNDHDSGIRFAVARLTPGQFAEALSRLVYVPCKIEVAGLERVGKLQEIKPLKFPLPDDATYDNRKKLAVETAPQHTEPGWVADTYYGSQGSFFQSDGKLWAKTIVRRWVDIPGAAGGSQDA